MRTLLVVAMMTIAAVACAQGTDVTHDKYVELLRSDVRAEKVAVLTEAMDFTDEQGSAFWPIYREYESELGKIYDERIALIKDFAANFDNMTEEKAKRLSKGAFDLRERQLKLLKSYHGKVEKAVDAITAARWAQVEHQLGMLIDLQVAGALPLIQ